MKATFTFDLPEEQEEYETYSRAGKYGSVLWDLDQWLRSEIKYRGKNEYEPVRSILHDFLNGYGIIL